MAPASRSFLWGHPKKGDDAERAEGGGKPVRLQQGRFVLFLGVTERIFALLEPCLLRNYSYY